MSVEEIVESAKIAKNNGANEFSIVTSGTRISDKNELKTIGNAVKAIKNEIGITPCASLGLMEYEDLLFLKKCGLEIFHHNIETNSEFFKRICTTHSFDDNIKK